MRRLRASLGGVFEEHHRLVARLVEQVVAQHRLEHAEHVAAVGEGMERGAAVALIEQTDAFDHRLLGGEVAVEVAGAHAGLFRHLLHRRGVKAMADEGALGGGGDMIAARVIGVALGSREVQARTVQACKVLGRTVEGWAL